MNIVFHGENAASFSSGFADLIGPGHVISLLPDRLEEADHALYAQADVIIGVGFHAGLPRPERLKLFHVPGAGYDAVDLALLPASATLCNCFGHEQAISEYVMSAILTRHVPLHDADQQLRQGHWAYWAGAANRTHDEMSGKTIGLLGYGHIGQAIAKRAKAFEMQVHVANRTKPAETTPVDRAFGLDELQRFYGGIDYLVTSLPLIAETKGLVNQAAFAAMRKTAVVINVGRGGIIAEQDLFDALSERRIAGAVIDTWYNYPASIDERKQPSSLHFNTLYNVVMTPHMSGWTDGTIRRRQQTIADNIRNIVKGQPCINVVRSGVSPT
jgi:phosphoglycerate dehydrogenase-like enzyme